MAALNKENLSFGDIHYHIYGVFSVSNIRASSLHSVELINTNSTNRPDSTEPHSMSEFDGYDHNAIGAPVLKQFYGTNHSTKAQVCGNAAETKYWHNGSDETPAADDKVYSEASLSSEIETGWVGLGTSSGFEYTAEKGVQSFYICRRKK